MTWPIIKPSIFFIWQSAREPTPTVALFRELFLTFEGLSLTIICGAGVCFFHISGLPIISPCSSMSKILITITPGKSSVFLNVLFLDLSKRPFSTISLNNCLSSRLSGPLT